MKRQLKFAYILKLKRIYFARVSSKSKNLKIFNIEHMIELFNPHTPVAQKVADEVVFDVSQVKESIFF